MKYLNMQVGDFRKKFLKYYEVSHFMISGHTFKGWSRICHLCIYSDRSNNHSIYTFKNRSNKHFIHVDLETGLKFFICHNISAIQH